MQFHSTFSVYWQIDFRYENKNVLSHIHRETVVTTQFLTIVVKAHSFDEAAPGSIIYIPAYLIL